MAEIQNNITNSTQVQFQICPLKTNLGTPAAGNIVFIKDTNELYLDGTYYGLSTTDAAKLEKAVTDISGLSSTVNQHLNLTNGLVEYVANLRKFADGEANSATGPVLITRPEGVLKGIDNVKAAIDALAAAVDTLNRHVWTAVTKPGNAGQFATSVTQGTDGSITVKYKDVESTDVKRTTEQQASITGETVEAALVTLKNAAEAAQSTANQNASDITVIKGTGDGSISKAVSDAKEALIDDKGSSVWGAHEKKTLTQLRELISTLQGIDDSTADRLDAIVNELKNADGTATGIDLAHTLLDKFLQLYGKPTDGKFRVNEQDITRLQDIINEIETEIGQKINGAIQGLNATVRGQLAQDEDKVVPGKHVGVKVVEENGELISVTVVEDDIASNKALSNLTAEVSGIKTTVEKHEGQLTWKVIS